MKQKEIPPTLFGQLSMNHLSINAFVGASFSTTHGNTSFQKRSSLLNIYSPTKFKVLTPWNLHSCSLLCQRLMTGTAMAGTNWFLRICLVMVGTSKALCCGVIKSFLWPWWVGYVTFILFKLVSTFFFCLGLFKLRSRLRQESEFCLSFKLSILCWKQKEDLFGNK